MWFFKGDTGPLVYPGGFVWLYAALYRITDNGEHNFRIIIAVANFFFHCRLEYSACTVSVRCAIHDLHCDRFRYLYQSKAGRKHPFMHKHNYSITCLMSFFVGTCVGVGVACLVKKSAQHFCSTSIQWYLKQKNYIIWYSYMNFIHSWYSYMNLYHSYVALPIS